MNEGREPADEVDAAVFGGFVERFREFERGRFPVSGEENRGGGNREAFVRDRNTVFRADFVTNVDEVFRAGNDLMVNLLAHQVDVRPGAVVEVERQGNGADVEVFRVQHADSGKDFVGSQHRDSFPSKKERRALGVCRERNARSALFLININIREYATPRRVVRRTVLQNAVSTRRGLEKQL